MYNSRLLMLLTILHTLVDYYELFCAIISRCRTEEQLQGD